MAGSFALDFFAQIAVPDVLKKCFGRDRIRRLSIAVEGEKFPFINIQQTFKTISKSFFLQLRSSESGLNGQPLLSVIEQLGNIS
ncbi:unnamed protein product [Hymenolepis diminuta]|uniref:Uncharacterized protein n=1 Tax=Hymenolepis diminuta TaxID=6216 RepID=A0A564YV42_HYMDI|nr:unnamed protein product [Hymenolepis diminuta]